MGEIEKDKAAEANENRTSPVEQKKQSKKIDRIEWETEVEQADGSKICPNALELHASYREKVTHEDGLVNTRTSWLLISQSIFFAALVFWLEKFPNYAGFWVVAFSIVVAGLVSCAATFVSVQAAFTAIDEAQSRWNLVRKKIGNHMVLPTVAGSWQGGRGVALGKYSANAISVVLFLAWVVTGGVLCFHGPPEQTKGQVGQVHDSQDQTEELEQIDAE